MTYDDKFDVIFAYLCTCTLMSLPALMYSFNLHDLIGLISCLLSYVSHVTYLLYWACRLSLVTGFVFAHSELRREIILPFFSFL